MVTWALRGSYYTLLYSHVLPILWRVCLKYGVLSKNSHQHTHTDSQQLDLALALHFSTSSCRVVAKVFDCRYRNVLWRRLGSGTDSDEARSATRDVTNKETTMLTASGEATQDTLFVDIHECPAHIIRKCVEGRARPSSRDDSTRARPPTTTNYDAPSRAANRKDGIALPSAMRPRCFTAAAL